MATAGYIELVEGDAPSTPDSGHTRIYPDSDGRPLAKNDAGTVFSLFGATVATNNVSNPPTDTELDSAFGVPSAANAGKLWVLDDNGANTNVYLVTTNGTSWFYLALTKAT